MTGAGAVVIVPPELESGFRLAGVRTVTAATAEDGLAEVERRVADRMEGVVVVYEPYLGAGDPAQRTRLESSLTPVVVALPTGRGAEIREASRARISEMLSRAVGYRITFGEEGRQ